MRRYLIPAIAAVILMSGYVLATGTDASRMIPVPPAPPTQPEPRYITTSGECTRNVIPDRGLITATATYLHPKSVREASKYVMDQYETLNKSVKDMGLADLTIQTSDYSVNPEYQWVQLKNNEPGKQVLTGYRARLGLSVKTSSIDKLGDVIAKAGDIGIAEVGGFQLMVSDALDNKIRTECLTEAVKNAKGKAEQMVTAAGAKLGHLTSVSESYAQPPMPMYAQRGNMMMAKMESADAAGMPAPQVQAGASTIQVNVSTTFRIE